jgi:hypothetical protein
MDTEHRAENGQILLVDYNGDGQRGLNTIDGLVQSSRTIKHVDPFGELVKEFQYTKTSFNYL